MTNITNEDVLEANINVHTKLADEYQNEPHFRPENKKRVQEILNKIFEQTSATKLLDFGCGTGFIIDLAKANISEITGVDITQAMLDKVDVSGSCKIELFRDDAGKYKGKKDYYDVVTSYAFLHHLYDIKSVFQNAYNSLKKGGVYYADLDPNYYFWQSLSSLNREGNYDPILKREIEMVVYKDEDVQSKFGIAEGIFDKSEYGKNIKGGFQEEELVETLKNVGFSNVKIQYHWFIGQAFLVNEYKGSRDERFKYASVMDEILHKTMPLARNLYKYIGFTAEK